MITVNSTKKRYKENGETNLCFLIRCTKIIIINILTYIYLGIVNGARAFVEGFEYDTRKDKTQKLVRIWVVFPDASTGSLLREDSKREGKNKPFPNQNPLAVPISQIKVIFEIPKIKIKVSRTQFPMVLCFCMTSYKSQGQTLQSVILDFKEAIAKHGHFYVGATRVRSAQGLFVRNFSVSQIQCREDVKKQLQILQKNKQYQFSKTYLETQIWENKREYKIGYLNINGLHHNLNNFDTDSNLSKLDFICIAETKLGSQIDTEAINNELGKGSNTLNENITPTYFKIT